MPFEHVVQYPFLCNARCSMSHYIHIRIHANIDNGCTGGGKYEAQTCHTRSKPTLCDIVRTHDVGHTTSGASRITRHPVVYPHLSVPQRCARIGAHCAHETCLAPPNKHVATRCFGSKRLATRPPPPRVPPTRGRPRRLSCAHSIHNRSGRLDNRSDAL